MEYLHLLEENQSDVLLSVKHKIDGSNVAQTTFCLFFYANWLKSSTASVQ